MQQTFRPLRPDEVTGVRLGPDEARQIALRQPGPGYGSRQRVAWLKVGCEFLGYYDAQLVSTSGSFRIEAPAYFVQVMGDSVPGMLGLNVALVIVHATTGEVENTISNGTAEPFLGTTCGVSP